MPRDRLPGTVAVRLLAFPGVDDLDLLGAYGVLSKAAELSRPGPRRLDVALAAEHARFETAGGLRLDGQAGLDEPGCPDVVLVPGGRGVRSVLDSASHLDYLRAAHRGGAALYSVCSGALLVAAAGLAGGATVAIHSAKRGALTEAAADCHPAAGLVRDGALTSVGGDPSGSVKSVDLALQLVADQVPEVLAELLERTELRQGRALTDLCPAANLGPGPAHLGPGPANLGPGPATLDPGPVADPVAAADRR